MDGYRVIDRQALTGWPSDLARIRINSDVVVRRVIRAPAVISLIQECETGLSDLDSWQSEGDVTTADDSWTMVAIYSGDVKCSASSWWNTGNPRHLVERWVVPVELGARTGGAAGPPLWDWLETRFERCEYVARDLPPGRWFRASWCEIQHAIMLFLNEKKSLVGARGKGPAKSEQSMVYLMREAGTSWVKVGACRANATSPPERRRAMYQPANRREISVVCSWVFEGRSPEPAMKQALRTYCRTEGVRYRSEWFCTGATDAAGLMERLLGKATTSRVLRKL